MNKESVKKKDPKKAKKIKMLTAIIIIAILAAISYFLLENPEIFERTEKQSPTSMYSDNLYSYAFYKADFDRDVTADEWYMQLDRSVHYKNGSVTVLVTPEEADDYNEAVNFFITYFDTVIAGDTETYNSFFTDEYYKKYEPHERFSPQMIYNIEVEELTSVSNDDGTSVWTYNVKYMIHKNDGTFRNDLDSDSTKTLYFELVGDIRGNVKINNITYYK